VVDAVAVIKEWGLDAFRYYVLRELDLGPDGNWTDAGFAARYNAELANGLGNLLNRSLKMLQMYRQGIIPAPSNELAATSGTAADAVIADLRAGRLQAGLVSVWSLVRAANEYIDRFQPFKLKNDPAQAARLDEILYNLCEVCRVLATLLAPYLPDTSAKMLQQLGLGGTAPMLADAAWGGLKQGHAIGEPAALFPRRDLPAK
jgi:methionyl-tRNA synthetase